MHLFHCPELGLPTEALPEEEAHHAVHVLRLSPGAVIGLLDGKGGFAEAEITATGKKTCTVHVLTMNRATPERRSKIHLAVAPTKQMERFEWFLEKATEIGVDRITPLHTHRTERSKLRHERMEKVLVGAMKQSQRRWLPQLDELRTVDSLASFPTAQKFFGWCEGSHADLTSVYDPARDALMLIGPEGDFTAEEAELLIAHGFTAISLGNARLRTETAAIAACTWMNFAQQR
ncbi:MAG: 16S rRNA (uracil(1498)-N(3))-methyltransferase [Flavobacteriales bacterium]|nr:16S rRNA (uracil(1498)-N(3))-methyltransferase [Flavobacteriales bacterium]